MPTSITTPRGVAATARGRRLDLGLTQAEVAERASMSRQWLNSFEAGRRSPSFGAVLNLFDVLGLELVAQVRGEARPAQSGSGTEVVDLDALLDDYRSR